MKKSILYSITGLLLLFAMAGCQQEEVITADGFNLNASISPLTRATDTAFEHGDAIGVYVVSTGNALQQMGNYGGDGDNRQFSFDGAGWSASSELLWRQSLGNVDVYAYYPYAATVSSVSSFPFSVATDQSVAGAYTASDFLWCQSSDIAYKAQVDLSFTHKLSKIKITLKAGAGVTSDDLTAASVAIRSTVTDATIDLSTGAVSLSGLNPVAVTPKKGSGNLYEAIVLPQTTASTLSDFIVVTVGSQEYSYKVTSLQLTAGKQHNYEITVKKNGLSVTVGDITGWENDPQDVQEGTIEGGTVKLAEPYFTGSFIQSWYILGRTDKFWQDEIAILKSVGITEIIIDQTFYYNEGNGGEYISCFPATQQDMGLSASDPRINFGDALDVCLRNCEALGMKVYVGLNYDDRHWGNTSKINRTNVMADMAIGDKVIDKIVELYGDKYPNALHGWYWSWEVNNVDFVPEANQTLLADALNHTLSYLNLKPGRRPIMLSPFMNKEFGMDAAAYAEMWKDVFAAVPFKTGDVFIPQDCMGTYLTLEDQAIWMPALAGAVKTAPGMIFGVNVETFAGLTSADCSRVIDQLTTASNYASKIVCFSYSHYYSPNNKQDYQPYHNAYKSYYDAK